MYRIICNVICFKVFIFSVELVCYKKDSKLVSLGLTKFSKMIVVIINEIMFYFSYVGIYILISLFEYKLRENFMFTIFKLQFFIFTITKETFSKVSSSLSDKRLLYLCYLYI